MSKFKNLIVFVGIIIFVAVFLLIPFVLKVKLECRTQYDVCPPEITNKINSNNNKSLASAKGGIKKSLKNDPLISEFSTQFKLPNILIVNVLIKKPSFVLKNDANQAVAVGQDGRVLGPVNNAILPTVMVFGNLKKVGEEVEVDHLFALNLIQGVNEMYQVSVGKVEDNSLVVEVPSGIKVIFPMDGDVQVLLGSLRLVYGKIESGEERGKYREIDLRFKNPVLR